MAADPALRDDRGMSNGFILRTRTWWRRHELDEQLIGRADAGMDARLARRAAQLRSPSTRLQFADALEHSLLEAGKRWSVSAPLPLRRVEVRQCAEDIIALARRLRDDEPVDVQGLAMVSRLVFDGTSPLYREGALTLRYAVRSARLALDPLDLGLTAVTRAGRRSAPR